MQVAASIARVDGRCLAAFAQRLRAVSEQLRGAAGTTGRLVPGGWSGGGRSADLQTAARVQQRLGMLAAALETSCLAISAVLAALQSIQAQAAAAARVLVSAGPEGVAGLVDRQLSAAVQAFEDADRRAAALLYDALLGAPLSRGVGSAGIGATRAGPAVLLSPPSRAQGLSRDVATPAPAPSEPAAVAIWWAGLPSVPRRVLSSALPWLAGGLDGVPPPLRDQINRERLAYAIRQAETDAARERSSLVHELTASAWQLIPWPLSAVGQLVAGGTRPATGRLRVLRGLRDAIRGKGKELLAFDAQGDGRAVVASGDVGSSRSLAVLVPGMDTTLGDAPRLVGQADRLASVAGGAAVAVAWLGYDAPNLAQVVSDSRAVSGAHELERFTAGVRATGRLRQHVSVIGHSYGTLVAGIAARHSLAADDLVLLASPGIEASRASQLHVPAGHVWAARAPTDPIQVVFWPARLGRLIGLPVPEVFGPDPAAPAFGARLFPVGGAYGHSGYFTAGSPSLDSLGRIVSGRPVSP